MNKKQWTTILGIIIITHSVSHIPYLYPTPFQSHTGIQNLSKEVADTPEFIKKLAGIGGYTQSDIENELKRASLIAWISSLIFILVGVLLGYLIVKRKNYARLLTIGYFLLLIIEKSYNLLSSNHILERLSLRMLMLKLDMFPIRTIQSELSFWVFLITIIYLLMPSVVKEFKSQTNATQ